MKTIDLMVGDWVICHHPTCEPKQIQVTVGLLNGLEQQDLGFRAEESPLFRIVEPIPLTAEILEKNGFEKFGENAYSFRRCGGDGEIKIKVIDLTCGEWELYVMDYDKYRDSCTSFSKEVSFLKVHELQHALKLCGIEKEIQL